MTNHHLPKLAWGSKSESEELSSFTRGAEFFQADNLFCCNTVAHFKS